MSLRERLKTAEPVAAVEVASARTVGPARVAYQELKKNLHKMVLERMDLEAASRVSHDRLREELRLLIGQLLHEQSLVVNEAERRTLVRDIQDEMLGLGPLESLLADRSISDILVNNSQQIYVERLGRLELSDVTFTDDNHLLQIIDRIVARVGRRIDESSPMVDARLADGSRVNAIIPPLSLDGPVLSIRRFGSTPLTLPAMLKLGSLTPAMAEVLMGVAKAKLNTLVSGGTGSGKTTLLNVLSGFIPSHERVITIEDAAELQLQQPHVVRLETRPANIEGRGEVTPRALVRNALRMRPDRIILGEVRDAEAIDLLQAMNTGHDGSMGTIHANTPREALTRLENMVGMSGLNMSTRVMRAQIASAITVIVQTMRLSDGRRKIVSVQEITGLEGEIITMQEIFGFRQTGVDETGVVQGHFAATGVRPKFAERTLAHGIKFSEELFDPSRRDEMRISPVGVRP